MTRSSRPLSLEVLKAALILQRPMRMCSRSARLYSVEPAPHSSAFLPFNHVLRPERDTRNERIQRRFWG